MQITLLDVSSKTSNVCECNLSKCKSMYVYVIKKLIWYEIKKEDL